MEQTAKRASIGIQSNLPLFLLLVLMNVFVGGMVGMERTVLPMIGEKEFHIASTSAALSFIVSFGFSKAITNFFAGTIADRIGRKNVLIAGWFVGMFVPLLVIVADHWRTIILANVLLGVNQGLTWSMTVNMKIDIASPRERGIAVGLNEFAGYTGVALLAYVSGYVSSIFSLRPEPFYIGIGLVIVGMILSLFVKDTNVCVRKNQSNKKSEGSLRSVLVQTTWKHRDLSSISFAGLATNLKDGMAWGLFPLFFATSGLSVKQIGVIIAVYPASWGLFQLFSGIMSDRFGRKWLITFGMWVQSLSIFWILFVRGYEWWIVGAICLGIGTAMVYPTLQAAISDVAHPDWRASAMGVYRLWRDSGYAFGAILAGTMADLFNIYWAIGIVACIPFLAGMVAMIRMKETIAKR